MTMSSEDDAAKPEPAQSPKRRRMHGACDLCRRKKVKCDSAKRPGMKCSNCVHSNSDCTHLHATQKAQRSRASSSESLSLLRESMNPVLTSILVPTYQAPTDPAIVRDILTRLALYARALEAAIVPDKTPHPKAFASPLTVSSNHASRFPTPLGDPIKPAGEEDVKPAADEDVDNLAEQLRRSLYLKHGRFFGPSSHYNFIRSALVDSGRSPDLTMSCMRPEFWTTLPWEIPSPPEKLEFDFPDPDLLESLVTLYFTHSNIYIPILHRPNVEKGIKAGLHYTNTGFAGVVLALSAVASRYSVDERVLLEEAPFSTNSSGFKWFCQIKHFHESSLRPPTIYELQSLCLSAEYLQGSSVPENAWYLVGFGIRAAYDIGLHQGKYIASKPTTENELRKRLFWILMMREMQVTIMTGRPGAVDIFADIDLDAPLLVDDEYWENPDPKLAFQQPSGKPSQVAFFNCHLNLIKIHFAAHQFLNATKRSDPPEGVSRKEWHRTKLAEIDSSLNAWVDAVPPHLRWDGSRSPESDPVFYDQSALLFTEFYYIQILVHRPFIGSQDEPALAYSSLAICTNAARACIRIMVTQSKEAVAPGHILFALLGSGIILLLGMWRRQQTGRDVIDYYKDTEALRGCIDLLEKFEDRWHIAGKFRDLLSALCYVGSISLEVKSSKAIKRSHNQLDNGEGDQGGRNTRRKSQATDLKHEELTVMPSPTSSAGSPASDNQSQYQYPFYSSELCKPFSQFASGGSVDTFALEKQLDDLEAMLEDSSQFTAASGSPNNVMSARQHGNQAIPGLSNAPLAPAFSFLAGAPSSVPTQIPVGFEQSIFNFTMPDMQTASMWTGVPLGHEWGDWSNYITSLEALTGPQSLPTIATNIPAPESHPSPLGYIW